MTGNFEHVVGAAQPVLAQTERAIREVAMAPGLKRDELLATRAKRLIEDAEAVCSPPCPTQTRGPSASAWRR
jgi:hypothetical protein